MKRNRIGEKPRETTARFTTSECKVLLKALEEARKAGGLLFIDLDVIEKIETRLKDRIEKEAKKDEDTGGDREGDSTTAECSAVGG